jgi:hypothetical protein
MRKEGKPERSGAGCNFETNGKEPDIINNLTTKRKWKQNKTILPPRLRQMQRRKHTHKKLNKPASAV